MDGLNDIVSAVIADISFSIKRGLETIINISDVTLIKEDLSIILQFYKLLKKVKDIIRKNFLYISYLSLFLAFSVIIFIENYCKYLYIFNIFLPLLILISNSVKIYRIKL